MNDRHTHAEGVYRIPRTSVFANTMLVGTFLTLAKLAGAVKIILMANRFGASDELDAFLAAFSLPAFFGEIVAGSLPAALVPALIAARETAGGKTMSRLHGSVTVVVLGLLAACCAVLAGSAPAFVGLIASGFGEAKRGMTREIFVYLLPLLPLGGLSVMWRSALISTERFTASSLAVGVTPLVNVAALLLAKPGTSVWVLVWATLAGIVVELVVLGAAIRRTGIPLLPRWSGWGETVRGVLAQYFPLIAAAAIGGGNLLLDQAMAATLAPGSVAALNYGIKLAAVIAAIAGGAIGTAVLPLFSRLAAEADWDGIEETFRAQGRLILFAGVPVCAVMIVFSSALVGLVFRNSSFGPGTVPLIAAVQQMSLLQIPIALLLAVALRLVAAMHMNSILLRVAVVNAGLNAAGDYVLMQYLGVPGIALASTLAMAVSFILVIFEIRKRVPRRRVLDFESS